MEGISMLHRNGTANGELPFAPTHFDPEFVGGPLAGFQRPIRLEGEIFNLEVEGAIPKEIAGTFYRIMPDPMFPPYFKNDNWINGDGVVTSFRVKDGHVDFRQRYVDTEKLRIEKQKRRTLYGKYRNPYTDLYDFNVRTVANTTIFPYRNMILALKEDGPPYAMNPETLQTYGTYDFNGQWKSMTFTAHPKYDCATRELLCFGYEAKGLGTKDNYYGVFDQHGKLVEEVWFKAPVCGFQHEMAVTENWVLFPITPMHYDETRVKAGGQHWKWMPGEPYYIGVLPRRGAKSEDIKWFYGDHGYVAHVANSWEESGNIHLLMEYTFGNAFDIFPEKEDDKPKVGNLTSKLCHWNFDPTSKDLYLKRPAEEIAEDNEFPRCDDRYMGHKGRYVFGAYHDKSPGKTDWKFVSQCIGGGFPPFNNVYKYDMETKKLDLFYKGDKRLYQEPVFIPRYLNAPEGDGWLVALTMNYEEMISELVFLDTRDMSKEVASCRLPFRLRMGIHGNWVDDSDVDGHGFPSLS